MTSTSLYLEYQELKTQYEALKEDLNTFNDIFSALKTIMRFYETDTPPILTEVKDAEGNTISTNQKDIELWNDRHFYIQEYLSKLSLSNNEYMDLMSKPNGRYELLSKGNIAQSNYMSRLNKLSADMNAKQKEINLALYEENSMTF